MPYSTGTTTNPPEFYAGKSSKGTHVFVINTESSSAAKTITFSQVPGLGAGSWKVIFSPIETRTLVRKPDSFLQVHDMWAGTDVGTFATSYTVTLATHDTAAFLITSA